MTTRAPCWAKRRAVPRPIPRADAAPVMMQTLSDNSIEPPPRGMGRFRVKCLEVRRPKDHKKLRSMLIPAAMTATGDQTEKVSKRRIALLLSQTAHFLRFLRLSSCLYWGECNALLTEHKRKF